MVRRPRLALPLTVLLLLVAGLGPGASGDGVPSAQGASPGVLRDEIARSKAQERSLGTAATRLGRLERATGQEVAVLQGRLDEARSAFDQAQALQSSTLTRLVTARDRSSRLRARLAEVRTTLASVLRSRYVGNQPDLLSVVFGAHGFSDLLETVEFLRRVEERDTMLLGTIRTARLQAGRQRVNLARLERARRAAAVATLRRRDALGAITAALRARQAALAQAHAARLAALRDTRAGRRRAQRELTRLEAARARAATATAGPGGPWAIPWAVVQCESGGQNLPPNFATASGYYQMLDSTWAGLGGSTKHAYQASKAEQDRLAARLWAGGSGARNWVCAVLVGLV